MAKLHDTFATDLQNNGSLLVPETIAPAIVIAYTAFGIGNLQHTRESIASRRERPR